VIPGRSGSELIAELPDPPPAEGSVLVEGLLAGHLRDRRGDSARRRAAAGWPAAAGHRARIPRPGPGGPRGRAGPAGDLVAGVGSPPRPGCPARPAQRAGRTSARTAGTPSAGSRAWTGTAHPLRVSPQYAVPVPDRLGDLGRAHRAGQRRGQGLGADRRAGPCAPPARVRGPGPALITGPDRSGCSPPLLGRQRGYQVHVFDRVTAGPKPALVAALGAIYHHGPAAAPGPGPGCRARVRRRRRAGGRAGRKTRPGGRDVPDWHLLGAGPPAGEREPNRLPRWCWGTRWSSAR